MINLMYVYLAKRDKKGIKVISSFTSKHTCYPTKINIKDLTSTLLPIEIQEKIINEFNKNKLIYEIYIESATSANQFRESLISRGFTNIPRHQISISLNNNPVINENILVTKNSTMIRRNSQARRT